MSAEIKHFRVNGGVRPEGSLRPLPAVREKNTSDPIDVFSSGHEFDEPAIDVFHSWQIAEDELARELDALEPDVRDSVKLYFNDIDKFPLLSKEQEVELAKRIKHGDVAAEELFTKSNLRLVVSVAKRYAGQGTPLLDLIQEGNIGLMKAVKKFDEAKGFRFSTYGTWWIRQAISKSIIDKGRIIRLPSHADKTLRDSRKRKTALEQQLGREVTHSEIAEDMDIDSHTLEHIFKITTPASLDAPIGEEDSFLSDVVPDRNAPFEETVLDEDLLDSSNKSITSILASTLPPRQAKIVEMRFGLNADKAMTLAEIGDEFGLTRERVRQIILDGLEKLQGNEVLKSHFEALTL